MVSGTISLPCSGFFAPFLHSTCSLSVSREYLALPDGPGSFTQDSSCPALLRIPLAGDGLRVPGCHRLWQAFPDPSARLSPYRPWSYNPSAAVTVLVWALPRSLATTWGIIGYFLFLQVLRCFSSLRLPTLWCAGPPARRVAPFGYPRIKGYLRLPAAFRSLSRPSSPPRAKASAMRPSLLSSVAWHRCHAPYFARCFSTRSNMSKILFLVENIGIEPMTSCLQGRRSSQLS